MGKRFPSQNEAFESWARGILTLSPRRDSRETTHPESHVTGVSMGGMALFPICLVVAWLVAGGRAGPVIKEWENYPSPPPAATLSRVDPTPHQGSTTEPTLLAQEPAPKW